MRKGRSRTPTLLYTTFMSRILSFAVALFTLAACLFGADLNGKWKGNLKSRNGDLETNMVLKVNGEKLTGTVANMYGEEEITEGLVKGDEISFIILAGGGQFKLVYKGKVEADQIRFMVTVGDFGESELIAKRAE
jgi:hypothetical protein